jgi:hypothetical protein
VFARQVRLAPYPALNVIPFAVFRESCPTLATHNASYDEANSITQPASRLDLLQPPSALGVVAPNDRDQSPVRSEPLGEIINARRESADRQSGA